MTMERVTQNQLAAAIEMACTAEKDIAENMAKDIVDFLGYLYRETADIPKRYGILEEITSGMSRPSKMLMDLARLREERRGSYGDDYLYHGKILRGLFPRGITLESEEEFNRFTLLILVTVKVDRYAANFKDGGHEDSLNDLAVYSQLLQHADELGRKDHAKG
jgi:hypothetical protein